MRQPSFTHFFTGWLCLLLLGLLASCGEDSFLIRRGYYHDNGEEKACLLRYNYDWTKYMQRNPSGMSVRLKGNHTGEQTDLTNNVTRDEFVVDADTFKLMVFNLSPSEFGSLTFYNETDMDSIRVKVNPLYDHVNHAWEGDLTYAQEPETIGVGFYTVVVSKENVERGDTIERKVTVYPLLSTLHLNVHVMGLKNMKNLAASLTGMADGLYLSHPDLPTDTCNLYLDNWTTTMDSDATNGWMTTSVQCFGLPQNHRDLANRDSLLNTLKLAFTLRDNTQRLYTFHVGDLFHYDDDGIDLSTQVSAYVSLNLRLVIDAGLPDRTITLPDVIPSGGSGFNAEVDPWDEGGNTDVTF